MRSSKLVLKNPVRGRLVDVHERGVEALERVAPALDVGVVGAEHADVRPDVADDPAGVLVRVRGHAHLAGDELARLQAQRLQALARS